MKKLYSYIIKSFIGPFILTFFICIFVLLMQFLWRYLDDLVGKGLDNGIVAELLAYAALSVVPLALPLSVLLASIMTFGNLGERLELIAMKASGISLLKIMRPLIYFNILITIGAFFLANNVVTATNTKFATLLWSVKKQRPELIIKEGVFSNDMDGYSIKVADRDNESGTLLDIMIYDHTDKKGNVSVTLADSGYLNMSDDKRYMILTLFNGESYNEGENKNKRIKTYPFRREKFNKEVVVISVDNYDFERADENGFKAGYKMLTNTALDSAIDLLYKTYYSREQLLALSIQYNGHLNKAIKTAFGLDSLNTDPVNYGPLAQAQTDTIFSSLTQEERVRILSRAQRVAQDNQRIVLQYQNDLYQRLKWISKHIVEWHKKYTLSVACLIFFFIGAPLGAIIRKGGFGLPVVVSILMFISYYVVSMIGEKVAREGVWTVGTAMWISSFIYLVVGLVLSYQAITDSTLLSTDSYIKFFKRINVFKYLIPKINKGK